MSAKARTAAPDEIYLQGVIGSFSDHDVTWCDHAIEDDDVRYLRAPASGLEPVPCPSCGSGDVGGASGIVHCYKCQLKVRRETTALATLAWNERAPLFAQALAHALTVDIDSANVITQLRKTIASSDAEITNLRAALAESQVPNGITLAVAAKAVRSIHIPVDASGEVVMRQSAAQFMERFLPASPILLWDALEKLAPSGGAWRLSKVALAYAWQNDPRLAGLTLDAIQEALP